MYSDFRDIRAARKRQSLLLEEAREVFPATIVTENGLTNYPELGDNWTWISLFNRPEENKSPAWNPTTLTEEGTYVLVARNPKGSSPYRWEIIGPNSIYEQETTSVPFDQFNTAPHASSHQTIDEADPGPDPIAVFLPMIYDLKTVGDGVTLTASTYGYRYIQDGIPKEFSGVTTDLTSSVPGAGLVRRVLIYLDRRINSLQIVNGDTVTIAGAPPIPFPEAPHEDVTRSAWVTLANGQTTIVTATDIETYRDIFGADNTVSLPIPTDVGQILMNDDPGGIQWVTPMVDESGAIMTSESGHIMYLG